MDQSLFIRWEQKNKAVYNITLPFPHLKVFNGSVHENIPPPLKEFNSSVHKNIFGTADMGHENTGHCH